MRTTEAANPSHWSLATTQQRASTFAVGPKGASEEAAEPTQQTAASAALGHVAVTDVRWVAFALGTVEVTDSEPRGVRPTPSTPRVSRPAGCHMGGGEDCP